MNAQFSGRSDLISLVLPKNRQKEDLLKFLDCFGILDSAAVHGQDKLLKLFFQGQTSVLWELKDPEGNRSGGRSRIAIETNLCGVKHTKIEGLRHWLCSSRSLLRGSQRRGCMYRRSLRCDRHFRGPKPQLLLAESVGFFGSKYSSSCPSE